MNKSNSHNRSIQVFDAVEYLYKNSRRPIAHWFWENHAQIVAEKALFLAKKYNANFEYAFAGGILHDLADVWLERTDVLFEMKSRLKAEQILKKCGFTPHEIESIIIDVIKPHSCHLGELPQIIEGKVLSTADALAHLQTDFYKSLKSMGLPEHINPSNFNEWVRAKIERDFHEKIAFEDERKEAKEHYDTLLSEFA